jgi:hypothetical protein
MGQVTARDIMKVYSDAKSNLITRGKINKNMAFELRHGYDGNKLRRYAIIIAEHIPTRSKVIKRIDLNKQFGKKLEAIHYIESLQNEASGPPPFIFPKAKKKKTSKKPKFTGCGCNL